jgi:hypothetical protein
MSCSAFLFYDLLDRCCTKRCQGTVSPFGFQVSRCSFGRCPSRRPSFGSVSTSRRTTAKVYCLSFLSAGVLPGLSLCDDHPSVTSARLFRPPLNNKNALRRHMRKYSRLHARGLGQAKVKTGMDLERIGHLVCVVRRNLHFLFVLWAPSFACGGYRRRRGV